MNHVKIWRDICRGLEIQERLLGAYVWGAAAAAVNALVRYAQNQETYYQRYAAAGFEPNDFGVTMALSIPLALYMAGRSDVVWLAPEVSDADADRLARSMRGRGVPLIGSRRGHLDAALGELVFDVGPLRGLRTNLHLAFEALQAGALEIVTKPDNINWLESDQWVQDLLKKIKAVAAVKFQESNRVSRKLSS